MSVPVVTFFNNKGGVGKTSLVYHLAFMLARQEERVLACDLDPQANLTALLLDESELEGLWQDDSGSRTIFQCLRPLTETSDIKEPEVRRVADSLGLIPGDLALSSFEGNLSEEWPKALGDDNLYRPFSILAALWHIMQKGARQIDATMILVDVGPNLGALNRSALIATDHVISPLGADLLSLQGLKNLGPTLISWREGWKKRLNNWPEWKSRFDDGLPSGGMQPMGYVVQQHSVRLNRPVQAYDKWVNRIPASYRKYLLAGAEQDFSGKPENDRFCLAVTRHYRSLVPMAQEARKPIFELASADGAIGSHAQSASQAAGDFRRLAAKIQEALRPS